MKHFKTMRNALTWVKATLHTSLVPFFILSSCDYKKELTSTGTRQLDSLEISRMITEREKGMQQRDLKMVVSQFDENVTWINSQGYLFEGINEVTKFHAMLNGNDSLDYYYKAGIPRIRLIDDTNAMAYYSWKMFWYKKAAPTDTTYREVGLMTLTARKDNGIWKWIAVTNQHTPWFYETIHPVKME